MQKNIGNTWFPTFGGLPTHVAGELSGWLDIMIKVDDTHRGDACQKTTIIELQARL